MCRILFATRFFVPAIRERPYEIFKSLSDGGNTDACGFAVLYEDGSVFSWKLPVSCEDVGLLLAAKPKVLRKIFDGNAVYVMIHARKATSGSPLINENNHPFCDERYCLIHNGSVTLKLTNIAEKARKIAEDIAETDSARLLALLKLVDGDTLLERATKAWSHVTGKASIAVFDRNTMEAIYTRNKRANITLVKVGDELLATTAESTARIVLKALGLEPERRLLLTTFINDDEPSMITLTSKSSGYYTSSYYSSYSAYREEHRVVKSEDESGEVTVYLRRGRIVSILSEALVDA